MSLQSKHNVHPEVWVVFTGKTDLRWLGFLKSGFRHCYVLLNDGQRWISLDPLSNGLDVAVHHNVPVQFDLPLWLKDRGHTIAAAQIQRPCREALWMPFTCVEAVKRVLGIQSRFIFTPWQLFRHIKQSHSQKIFKGEPAWEACLQNQR